MYVTASIGGLVLSILGLIGAAFVKTHPRIASVAMLISGGLGLFVALGMWIGTLLLLVAGIIGLIRKEKRVEPAMRPASVVPESGMMFCHRCGKQIPKESRFCHAWGAKLA